MADQGDKTPHLLGTVHKHVRKKLIEHCAREAAALAPRASFTVPMGFYMSDSSILHIADTYNTIASANDIRVLLGEEAVDLTDADLEGVFDVLRQAVQEGLVMDHESRENKKADQDKARDKHGTGHTPVSTAGVISTADHGMKNYTLHEPWLAAKCKLGEGPHYDASTSSLRFVDILARQIHTVKVSPDEPEVIDDNDYDKKDEPSSTTVDKTYKNPVSVRQIIQLDHSIGTTAEIDGRPDEFVFAGKRGYGICDKRTGRTRWIKEFRWTEEQQADIRERARVDGRDGAVDVGMRQRANDGTIDASGRFLVGTMNDADVVSEPQKEGVVFSLDSRLQLSQVFSPVTIPNGTSFSPDNRYIYMTDSSTRTIRKLPYDPSTGRIDTIAPSEVFFTTESTLTSAPSGDDGSGHPDLGGVPDGHARDVNHDFWIAIYGAGKIYHVDHLTGRIKSRISVPTRGVTCCCFVGEWLYITTAAEEEPDAYPTSAEFGGGVFRCHVGVRGAEVNKFRIGV